MDQYDIDTGQYSQLINLDSLVSGLANTYAGGIGASAGAIERIMTFFGGTSQDEHFYLLVFDKADPSRRHLLNTLASTLDGQSPTALNFRFMRPPRLQRRGVIVYPTADDLGAPRYRLLPTCGSVTNRLTALPLIPAITGGRRLQVWRSGQPGLLAGTRAAQWYSAPFSTRLSPSTDHERAAAQEIYLEDHPSWHNAQPDRLSRSSTRTIGRATIRRRSA